MSEILNLMDFYGETAMEDGLFDFLDEMELWDQKFQWESVIYGF